MMATFKIFGITRQIKWCKNLYFVGIYHYIADATSRSDPAMFDLAFRLFKIR